MLDTLHAFCDGPKPTVEAHNWTYTPVDVSSFFLPFYFLVIYFNALVS